VETEEDSGDIVHEPALHARLASQDIDEVGLHIAMCYTLFTIAIAFSWWQLPMTLILDLPALRNCNFCRICFWQRWRSVKAKIIYQIEQWYVSKQPCPDCCRDFSTGMVDVPWNVQVGDTQVRGCAAPVPLGYCAQCCLLSQWYPGHARVVGVGQGAGCQCWCTVAIQSRRAPSSFCYLPLPCSTRLFVATQ
jgi:hypothetical protein